MKKYGLKHLLWVLGLGLVLLILYKFFKTAELGQAEVGRFIYSVLLISLLGGSVAVRYRGNASKIVKDALLWVIIILGFVLIYSFRFEAMDVKDRLLGELLPDRPQQVGDGSIRIKAAAGGHYFLKAKIYGKTVRFMVDTGASDVILRLKDAERLGYDVEALSYSKVYRTANGPVHAAPVVLEEVVVGDFIMNDVRASINSSRMSSSLLGMSFLRRFSKYQFEDDTLILWP